MPSVELSALRPGDVVAGVYACTRKDRLTARTGSPYLALELRDRTSALPARVFRDADLLGGRFERGDLVRVQGRVERFRDELQVEVRAIERAADGDPAAFLPVAYRDVDELDGFLEHLAREVHDPAYRALLEELLADDALRAEWRRAPCTRAGHHAYLGGLLEHTVAVGTLALEACQLHPRLDSDLLICAALVHDLGKTREFTYGAEIGLHGRGAAARPRRARPAAPGAPAGGARRAPAGGAAALRPLPPRARRPPRAAASGRPRRSRCTGSTHWTPASRARWNMV